jgi:hypothetical protein
MGDFVESACVVGSGSSTLQVEDNAALVNLTTEFDQAVAEGRAFSFGSLTYDPDAHDTIIAVQNTSTDHLFKVQKILFTSDTASLIHVFAASGVTMTGTAVTGVNLNRSSGRTAQATAICDETDNGEQASSYPLKFIQEQVAANTLVTLDINGGIVLPYGIMIGVDLTTAATAANGTIIGYFEPV